MKTLGSLFVLVIGIGLGVFGGFVFASAMGAYRDTNPFHLVLGGPDTLWMFVGGFLGLLLAIYVLILLSSRTVRMYAGPAFARFVVGGAISGAATWLAIEKVPQLAQYRATELITISIIAVVVGLLLAVFARSRRS